MTRWRYPPELARARERDFDPVVEGARCGLSREASLAIWERVCADATDSTGRLDASRAQRQFRELAERIAAHGGRLEPDVGRVTRAQAEIDGLPRGAWLVDELAPPAPGRTTLVDAELPRSMTNLWSPAHTRLPSEGPKPSVPGRTTLVDELPGRVLGFEDYRVLGLRAVLQRLGPDHALRPELVAAAAAADRSVAGRATLWRATLPSTTTPDGHALWQATERHAVTLYRRAMSRGEVDEHDPSVQAALQQRGTGQPLPTELLREMEHEFGVALDGVRIHADAISARAAHALRADAFTVGEDIFFAEGTFAPNTRSGRKLLAHELTHVVQALRASTGAIGEGRRVSQPGEPAEQEADAVAARVEVGPGDAATPEAAGPHTRPDTGRRFANGGSSPHASADSRRPALPVGHAAPASHPAPRIYRQVPPGASSRAAPAVDLHDSETFAALLEALDGIGEVSTSEIFSLEVHGRTIHASSEQVVQLQQTATREIRCAATQARNSAEGDLDGYQYQQQINRDSWIVSPIVHVVGGIHDPGRELTAQVTEVRAAVQLALSATRLSDAWRALVAAERAAQEAHRLWWRYNERVISTAEGSVRTLTFTRDAAFLTLGVLAAIATGGAATATVAGIEVSTTTAATAISVGAPIVARIGEAGVRAGLGEQVDWVRVAADTVVDLVLVRLGGRLAQGLFQRLGGNPAVRRLGADLARRVFTSVVMHEGATALRVIVDAIYRRMHGQAITWEQFGEALLDQMTDPRGLFIAVVMGAVETAADRRHGTPREFDVRGQDGRPVTDIDEMRGGTLYEDKNAAGLSVIPPGRSAPNQSAAEWAQRQIYEITVRRLTGIPRRTNSTAQGRQPGSTRNVPNIADVQNARRYVFRIEVDNLPLRTAVQAELARLQAQFPDWTFDAIFGYRPIRQ